MDRQTLLNILDNSGFTDKNIESVIDILFWFGFLGFIWTDGDVRFIYSFNYSMQVLRGSHNKLIASGILYVINPAFISALGVQQNEQRLI